MTSHETTVAHIARVQHLLDFFADAIRERGRVHDASKFDPEEAVPLQRIHDLIQENGPAPFGTPEYKERTAMLGPMLSHHYSANSHHPEHYENGVSGMDLLDLVEMFFDWKAASERNADSGMGLSFCIEKYKIDPMLASILRNTADRLGYAHK